MSNSMQKNIKSCSSYEIIQSLASGGMGSVVKAKLKGVEGFEKLVAIKMLLPQYANDEAFVQRFVFEAKLVANLVHENIVQIYQLDKIGNEYFFVQEFVDGISLYDFVEFHRMAGIRLPQSLAVFIAAQASRALAYAHSRRDAANRPLNIIHCDICPHNILINREGVPKITDFGIAKAATVKDDGHVAGKLAFMSPEQYSDPHNLTPAVDIYSLGTVLFYMLSLHYSRDVHTSQYELFEQIRNNYVNWSVLPDDLPDELLQILHDMLSGDPAERCCGSSANAAQMLEHYIYKDGYGPGHVTLAEYMQSVMPGRFGNTANNAANLSTPENDSVKTIKMSLP